MLPYYAISLLAEGHFPSLVLLHGILFLHFWETKC